ncbi:exported protein of unknown function [Tenacibaculum sp. 190524A02b]|uniref:lipocalin family protein n=1 Tax=Tenacibaculum vairaonense TaxID=3137860 RepID=UPI0032B24841
MKKLLILIVSIVFANCSNSDDNLNTNSSDPLIGKWAILSMTEDGKNILNSCDAKCRMEFYTNNTYKYDLYQKKNQTECEGTVLGGKWEKKDDTTYIFHGKDSSPEFILKNNLLTLYSSYSIIKNGVKVEIPEVLVYKKQ